MNSQAELTDKDATLIHAFIQGESLFNEVTEKLNLSAAVIVKWLCTPLIAETIKKLKAVELDRCTTLAARARSFLMTVLKEGVDDATEALRHSEKLKPGSSTQAAAMWMRIATLLTRLCTFKPIELKELPSITKQPKPTQPTLPRRYVD